MRDVSVAVLQLSAGPNIGACVTAAAGRCAAALEAAGEIVVLPENYWGIASIEVKRGIAVDLSRPGQSLLISPFLALSASFPDSWILLGGLPERPASGDPAAERGLLYNTLVVLHGGRVVAHYRKIHRFDADLPNGVSLRESATTAGGERPVVVHTPLASIGLSICYDLRFPSLFRALAEAGAEVIVAPSAFTVETGLDHWEVLLRARALDTQCYVLAPALHGRHNETRQSFGHSMIVDPWGTVIAHSSGGDSTVSARLTREVLQGVRARLPILRHRILPGGPRADSIDLRGVT